MMKIRAIRARGVAAPMKRPLATSTGTVGEAALLLIDLRDRRGHHGPHLSLRARPAQPGAHRQAGRGHGGDGERRRGGAVRPRAQAAREATRCSACTTSCFSRCRESTWPPGTRLARRMACRSRGSSARAAPGPGLQLERPGHPAPQGPRARGGGAGGGGLPRGEAAPRPTGCADRISRPARGEEGDRPETVTLMVDFNQALTVAEAIRARPHDRRRGRRATGSRSRCARTISPAARASRARSRRRSRSARTSWGPSRWRRRSPPAPATT